MTGGPGGAEKRKHRQKMYILKWPRNVSFSADWLNTFLSWKNSYNIERLVAKADISLKLYYNLNSLSHFS